MWWGPTPVRIAPVTENGRCDPRLRGLKATPKSLQLIDSPAWINPLAEAPGLPYDLQSTIRFCNWHADCLFSRRSPVRIAEDNGCRVVKRGGQTQGGRSIDGPLGRGASDNL